jgi:phycobilisome core-membrane linker protein
VPWLIAWNTYNYLVKIRFPDRRFPTLPAANFPNTERLYNKLTKQDSELVVPSFKPVVKVGG